MSKDIKFFTVSVFICLVMMFISGCSYLDKKIDFQVVDDSQILALATPNIKALADQIKAKHPEKVENYLSYCDRILNEEDKNKVETYINLGINSIIDNNVDDPMVAMLIKASFKIKVDGDIDFDMGSYRVALDLVRMLKAALEN